MLVVVVVIMAMIMVVMMAMLVMVVWGATPVLTRIATERGWRIEYFRNPVTLRSRIPHWDRPEVTGRDVIGLAVVGVALVGAWWLSRRGDRRQD